MMLKIFSCAVFISAFLLFVIQPIIGKMLLPLLGGTPAVWNTCMVFFQILLLAGYLYSHLLTRNFSLKKQAIIHLIIFGVALYFLPVRLPESLVVPTDGSPIWWVFKLLFSIVALPFFVLSASAPLIQRWFSYTRHRESQDPYFLYVASNCGSLLALIGYPFLIEPFLNSGAQSSLWRFFFMGLLLLFIVCLIMAVKLAQPLNAADKNNGQENPQTVLKLSRKLNWVFLGFVPSSLMLGVTTYITTDIAAVPLIWIIPLALYLISFILVFSRKMDFFGRLAEITFPRALMCIALMITIRVASPMSLVIMVNLATFFIVALLCHGRLAKDRPAPDRLTEYYLWMSFGGALGGIFNAILAPLIFDRLLEYPLILAISCLAYPRAEVKNNFKERLMDFVLPAALTFATWLSFRYFFTDMADAFSAPIAKVKIFLAAGIPALIAFSFRKRPVRMALAFGLLMLVGIFFTSKNESTLITKRSFFGISTIKLRQINGSPYHSYLHGTTTHGLQKVEPGARSKPLSYFHQLGPLGDIFRLFNQQEGDHSNRVAVIGLGTGSAAFYAKKDQHWDFYEIDPTVVSIAENSRYFNFLEQCRAQWRVIVGDGRLNIKKAEENFYDLIILDAFSSDAIPVHLITKQAVELYFSKLSEKGLLAFHISNRYIRLENVLADIAQSLGMTVYLSNDETPNESDESKATVYYSKWVVMARNEASLHNLTFNKWSNQSGLRKTSRVWTDDYSNILSAL